MSGYDEWFFSRRAPPPRKGVPLKTMPKRDGGRCSEAGAPRLLVTALAIGVAGFGPGLAAAHSLKEFEAALNEREAYAQIVHYPAAPFALKDADDRPVKLSDYRGKVVLLYFIYAGCKDVCPLQSQKLAGVQRDVNATPMRNRVQFVAVTTDPVGDTPSVMTAYPRLHGLDTANWVFLTSGKEKPAATRELAEQYGLKFTLTSDGVQMHGVVTHLIDKSGNLRVRYHGLKFNSVNLVAHINALLNDIH